jgi:hypothetical protein
MAERGTADPWVVLKADSGDVEVSAMCVPQNVVLGLPKKGETSRLGERAVVEIVRREQGATESPLSEWRAWIAWRGHARLVNLDVSSVCSGCGRLIMDAAVNPDGIIVLGH